MGKSMRYLPRLSNTESLSRVIKWSVKRRDAVGAPSFASPFSAAGGNAMATTDTFENSDNFEGMGQLMRWRTPVVSMATTAMRGARSSRRTMRARTTLERSGTGKERTTVFEAEDESLRF